MKDFRKKIREWLTGRGAILNYVEIGIERD